jgi:hypothetical protein
LTSLPPLDEMNGLEKLTISVHQLDLLPTDGVFDSLEFLIIDDENEYDYDPESDSKYDRFSKIISRLREKMGPELILNCSRFKQRVSVKKGMKTLSRNELSFLPKDVGSNIRHFLPSMPKREPKTRSKSKSKSKSRSRSRSRSKSKSRKNSPDSSSSSR